MFKDKEGRYLTRALFKETSNPDTMLAYPPKFTLKNESIKGFKSLREIYLDAEDPTEYTFAINTFGSWEHWNKLCECTWFEVYLIQWREELEIKMRSKGVLTMADLAVNDKNKDAAKWLASGGWKVNSSGATRGRPTNAEVEGEKKKQARMSHEVKEDAERLGLTIIKNV